MSKPTSPIEQYEVFCKNTFNRRPSEVGLAVKAAFIAGAQYSYDKITDLSVMPDLTDEEYAIAVSHIGRDIRLATKRIHDELGAGGANGNTKE